MRFQFTHKRSARALTTTCRRTRASSRPRSFKTPSHILLARNYLHRNRAVSFLHCMCVRARCGSFITSPCSRVRARARERVYAHTHDDGGDSRGQARRRRRLARSSLTTATTTVNEIVRSVSANYRAVPGVRGASLRSYPPSCVVTRKGVASGREKSAITPTRRSRTVHGSRNRSNPGEFDSQCRGCGRVARDGGCDCELVAVPQKIINLKKNLVRAIRG